MEKNQNLTVKVSCDNSEIMDALQQIENKIDVIQNKMNRLVQTINDCAAPSGSDN